MEGKEISGNCTCPKCGFYKISMGKLEDDGIINIIGEYKRQWKSIELANGTKNWAFCGFLSILNFSYGCVLRVYLLEYFITTYLPLK